MPRSNKRRTRGRNVDRKNPAYNKNATPVNKRKRLIKLIKAKYAQDQKVKAAKSDEELL